MRRWRGGEKEERERPGERKRERERESVLSFGIRIHDAAMNENAHNSRIFCLQKLRSRLNDSAAVLRTFSTGVVLNQF